MIRTITRLSAKRFNTRPLTSQLRPFTPKITPVPEFSGRGNDNKGNKEDEEKGAKIVLSYLGLCMMGGITYCTFTEEDMFLGDKLRDTPAFVLCGVYGGLGLSFFWPFVLFYWALKYVKEKVQ